MKFRYKKSFIDPAPGFDTGLIYRPIIPIVLVGANSELRFNALVDTGSDQTILPLIDVEPITGIAIDRSVTSSVRGRLEHHTEKLFLGRNCKLRLSDDNTTYEFSTRIWFSDDDQSPAILGHNGFLDFFNIFFDGSKKELEIIPSNAFTGTQKKISW